jgi:hypothetical protein
MNVSTHRSTRTRNAVTRTPQAVISAESDIGPRADAEPQRQSIPSAATLVCREKKLGQTAHPLGVTTYQPKEGTGPPDGYTPPFPPLESVTRPTVPTEQAAYYLERRPQTLRGWACHEDGPLRPLRVNSRLHWKTSDLRNLLGMI